MLHSPVPTGPSVRELLHGSEEEVQLPETNQSTPGSRVSTHANGGTPPGVKRGHSTLPSTQIPGKSAQDSGFSVEPFNLSPAKNTPGLEAFNTEDLINYLRDMGCSPTTQETVNKHDFDGATWMQIFTMDTSVAEDILNSELDIQNRLTRVKLKTDTNSTPHPHLRDSRS